MHFLHFAPANAKLIKLQEKTGKKLYSFSTLSGWGCGFADKCYSRAVYNGESWKIQDGPNTEFRCFSASQEVIFPAVREARLQNHYIYTIAASDKKLAADTILAQLPKDAEIIRIHVAGDFLNLNYLDAWLSVIRQTPHIEYYAYTKAIPLWLKRINDIPHNLRLTASFGGKRDDLIAQHNLRYAKVVYSEDEANTLGLSIDHDDSLALNHGPNFALILHGPMPKGSEASKAMSKLKKRGFHGYSR